MSPRALSENLDPRGSQQLDVVTDSLDTRGTRLADVVKGPLSEQNARRANIIAGFLIAILFVAVYMLVRWAGGMWFAWGQLFYVPIMFAAMRHGPLAALISAIIAGLLAGPAMPQNAAIAQAQSTANWVYRMALFAIVALTASLLAHKLQRQKSNLDVQDRLIKARAAALSRSIEQTMRALVACIEPHFDAPGDHHSLRVARLSAKIGEAMGIRPEKIPDLWWGGFVHDIGKVGIPQRLLQQGASLTPEEKSIVRRHPVIGRDLLRAIPAIDEIRAAVEFHHERWDGAGHPDGRKGRQIPMAARIVAVADTYDHAMNEDGVDDKHVVDIISSQSGSAFDPQVVSALKRIKILDHVDWAGELASSRIDEISPGRIKETSPGRNGRKSPSQIDEMSSSLTRRVMEFVEREAEDAGQMGHDDVPDPGHQFTIAQVAFRLMAVLAGLAFSTWVIFITGGTAHAWGHIFYIPIIAAALWFGPSGGTISGALAGIFQGPWMPLDVPAGIMQPAESWIFRTIFFATMGGILGSLYYAIHCESGRILSGMTRYSILSGYLENLTETVLRTMARTIESVDQYTRHHSELVSEYAVRAGKRMGLSVDQLAVLKWAGIVHDLGKVGIAEHILAKPGPLTLDERDHMRTHVDLSRRIIEQVDILAPALPAVWSHHERFDGSGYPRGLRGDNIPIEGRILAVADVYEALTSDRPYRRAWSRAKALQYLEMNAGTLFDPDVVRAFIEEFGASSERSA